MIRILFTIILMLVELATFAQCAMCTKTAASLDDKAAKGLNGGIIYLAFMPLIIMGVIGYKWWQKNKETI